MFFLLWFWFCGAFCGFDFFFVLFLLVFWWFFFSFLGGFLGFFVCFLFAGLVFLFSFCLLFTLEKNFLISTAFPSLLTSGSQALGREKTQQNERSLVALNFFFQEKPHKPNQH